MTTEIKFPPAPEPAEFFVFNEASWDRATRGYFDSTSREKFGLYNIDQLHAYARPIIEQRDELLAKLEQANARLRETEGALDFYGRYILRSKKDNSCHVLTPIDHDCGDRARSAIAKAEATQDLPAILKEQAS